MVFDFLVAQRLRDGGIVDFAVAVAAIADEVDDDVGAEIVAVFGGHAGDANDCVGVFGVDVEDRDGLARARCRRQSAWSALRVAGGEAEEIVDDDVNGAADGVAGKVGIVHGLGEDALSGEGGVAVNQKREISSRAAFAGAVLLGASAADGDRIDSFEVAGIRDQMDVNFAAAVRDVFAGGAHVVLHVAAAEDAARVDVFEAGEDFLRRTLREVGHDVEAAAMAHAHDEFDGAERGGGVEHLIKERDQGGDAFEREALGAEVARLDDLLEDVGADRAGRGCAADLLRVTSKPWDGDSMRS